MFQEVKAESGKLKRSQADSHQRYSSAFRLAIYLTIVQSCHSEFPLSASIFPSHFLQELFQYPTSRPLIRQARKQPYNSAFHPVSIAIPRYGPNTWQT